MLQKKQIKAAAVAIALHDDYAREVVKVYNQQGHASRTNRRQQLGRQRF